MLNKNHLIVFIKCSGNGILFLATVEECLLDEVNRRTSGFLRSNKIANIYTKVAKGIPAVGELIKQIEEAEAKLERFVKILTTFL